MAGDRKDIMMNLQADIETAKKGREIWLEIKKQYSFETIHDCLVILPSRDMELNLVALEEISAYMQKKYLHKAIIISTADISRVESEQSIVEEQNIFFKQLEEIQCRQLLKYYRLTQFTKNVVVVSLNEPYGNGNIIGNEGITLKDYMKNAIFV